MTRLKMPLALPSVVALCLLMSAGASAAEPSFNCAKARSVAEKAICRNPGLAAQDVQIAGAYRTLRGQLDAPAAAALADDQRWFVNVRDAAAEAPKDMSPPDLGAVLKDRAKFLGAIDPRPPEGFAGSWRNLAGGFDIKVGANGALTVEGNAAQPANGNWVCEYHGSGKASGNVLKPRTEEMDANSKRVAADADSGSLRFVREGALLKVETVAPSGGAGASFCGMNGSFDGAYFRVPQGYN